MGHRPFPSPHPKEILHRPFSGVVGILLAGRIFRRGILMTPPMVQHPGNVSDGKAGFLRLLPVFPHHHIHSPDDNIIVLGAVAHAPKAKLLHQLTLHHQKMADIIVGKKQIKIKIRFSIYLIIAFLPAVTFILVRIQKLKRNAFLFIFFNAGRHLVEGVPCKHIVMVQKTGIVPRGIGQRLACIGGNTGVLPFFSIFNPPVRIGLYHFFHLIGAAGVRNNQFKVSVALSQYRVNHGPQMFFPRLISRYKNAEPDLHMRCSFFLLLQSFRCRRHIGIAVSRLCLHSLLHGIIGGPYSVFL